MPLWKIYPVAGLQDPRWEGRCIWKEVVVRAPSAAMARLVAAAMERDLDIRMRGDARLCFRSGFQDEKIYWVVRIRAEDAAAIGSEDGPNEVIKAVTLKEFPRRCATKPEQDQENSTSTGSGQALCVADVMTRARCNHGMAILLEEKPTLWMAVVVLLGGFTIAWRRLVKHVFGLARCFAG